MNRIFLLTRFFISMKKYIKMYSLLQYFFLFFKFKYHIFKKNRLINCVALEKICEYSGLVFDNRTLIPFKIRI